MNILIRNYTTYFRCIQEEIRWYKLLKPTQKWEIDRITETTIFFFEFVTEKIISLLLWLLCAYSFSKSTKEVINYVQRAWYCPNTFPRNTGRTKYKINNTNTDILLFLKWKYRYRGNENLKQIKRIIYLRKYLLYLINLNHIFGAPRESLRCSNYLPFASTWVHPHFVL